MRMLNSSYMLFYKERLKIRAFDKKCKTIVTNKIELKLN